MLKESVSEAKGTAKVAWLVAKLNTTTTSPVHPQNPSNSSNIACTSEKKRGKNYEKKTEEKRREMKGLAVMALAIHDHESSNHSFGQTKRARESSNSLSSTTNLPPKHGGHEVPHDTQGGKAKKRRLAQALQLAMLGQWSCEGQQSKINFNEKRVLRGWWYWQHGSSRDLKGHH